MSHEPKFPLSNSASRAEDRSEHADDLMLRRLVQDAYADVPTADTLWHSFSGVRDAGRTVVADTGPVSRISSARSARSAAWYRRPWAFLGSALALCAVIVGVVTWTSGGGFTTGGRFAEQEYRTLQGEFASLMLPDGSVIELAPKSRIVYKHAASGERQVMLSGQAVFRVVHASVTPLVVVTTTGSTRVLGTTFSVREYASDASVQVVVEEGRVATGVSKDIAIVNAGYVATVTDSSVIVTAKHEASNVVTWTNRRATFTNTSIHALLETLGRWYGYTFHLSDSTLAARQVSTVLDIDKPDEVLQMIGSLLDVGMTIKGDTVILSGRHANRSPVLKLRPTPRPLFSTGMEVGK